MTDIITYAENCKCHFEQSAAWVEANADQFADDEPLAPCVKTAITYAAERGWKVFPARLEGGQKYSWLSAEFAPGHENWGMSNDPEYLKKNFTESKWQHKCGVGIPTGAENSFFVLETDTIAGGHAADGAASLRALEDAHSPLPPTLMAESPTGSLHRYFKHPGIKVWGSASIIAPGVDVKGDGGMVIAPPSLRPGVGIYRWVNDLPIAEAPEWLITLVTQQPSSAPTAGEERDPFEVHGEQYSVHEPLDIDEVLDGLEYPGNIHDSENRLLASNLSHGEPVDDAIETIINELSERIPEARHWDMKAERKTLQKSAIDWFIKRPEVLEQQPKPWPLWLAHSRKIKGLCASVNEPMVNGPAAKGKEPTDNGQKAKSKPTERKAAAPVVVPVDLWKQPEAPPLPHGLLPPVIEEFAFAQGTLMGANPAGLAMGAVTVIAAVIPDRIQLQPKEHEHHWKESARLWTALVGPVSAMKTPIMRMVDREVKRIDRELARKYQAAMAAWKALSSEERAKTPEPRHTRLRIEDTTPEALQEILKDSPDGVYCSRDELGGWFGSMDKYAGNRGAAADRGFWLSAYNGDDYAVDRIGRGSGVIEHLSVSILGGIQPEPARKLLDDGNDDGLIQRLIPIMLSPCDVGKDEPMSQAVDRYNDLVRGMYNRLQNAFCNDFQFTAGARAIRQQLEIKHRDLMQFPLYNRKLQAHIGKYNGLFVRLCLIWHTIEHWADAFPSDVDAYTAQRVARFMHEYLLPHAVTFYSEVTGLTNDYDHLLAIAGYILAHGLTRVTNRDVQRGDGTMRRLGRQDQERLFLMLDGYGWGDYVPGRRFTDPPSLTVNPEVHVRFARYAKDQQEQRKRMREIVIAKATGEQK